MTAHKMQHHARTCAIYKADESEMNWPYPCDCGYEAERATSAQSIGPDESQLQRMKVNGAKAWAGVDAAALRSGQDLASPTDTEMLDWLERNPAATIEEHEGAWFFKGEPFDGLRPALLAALREKEGK